MKTIEITILLTFLALVGACSREGKVPSALTPEQVPSTLKGAFSSAKPQIKQASDGVGTAVQQGDYVGAFNQLTVLSGESQELTPEQREALGRSQALVMQKLNEAAATGDARAAAAVEMYRSSK